jgi:hypothetical protein
LIKFDRQRLIFGFFVLMFIVVTELVTALLKLPAWPAYVVWTLFFIEQMNAKKAPHILVGAATGIGLILLAPPSIGLLAPMFGAEWGRLVYILLAVYAIVAFGEMVPLVLNNYAFLYFIIGGLALQVPGANPYVWMFTALIGGGLLIGGTMVAGKIMGALIPTGQIKARTITANGTDDQGEPASAPTE